MSGGLPSLPTLTSSFEERELSRWVIRRAEFEPDESQAALRASYRSFFGAHAPVDVVRAAEPTGFAPDLWRRLCDLRTLTMALPESSGGDGAGLGDLVLVCEELGRHLAPVPLIDGLVAARLLAGCEGATARSWRSSLEVGADLIAVMVEPHAAPTDRLTAQGAIASAVLGMVADRLVLTPALTKPQIIPNLASLPMAVVTLGGSSDVVLADGPEAHGRFVTMRREWFLLSAAALVGVAQRSLEMATDQARERHAFGVPIGFFQALSHPLADLAVDVECGRRLVAKAAWFQENGPERPELVLASFLHAQRTAMAGSGLAVHVLGGTGYTLEADAQLFYRRAGAWASLAGDPEALLDEIADSTLSAMGIS